MGAFYFAFITALNTTLQAQLDDAVRGRVMALWIMGFGGTVALGNLLVGPVVAAVGITSVLLFGAGVALVLVWYADVRPPPGSPGWDWGWPRRRAKGARRPLRTIDCLPLTVSQDISGPRISRCSRTSGKWFRMLW